MIGTWGRADAHFDAISKRERRRPVRRGREPHGPCRREVSEGQELRRLAQMPRTEGHRCGGLLHAGSHPRLHRQLGDEPRPARLLREAAGQHRRGSTLGPRELPQEQGTSWPRRSARSVTPTPNFNRVRELIRDGAIGELKRCVCLGRPPDSQARLSACQRRRRPRTFTTTCGSGRRRSIHTTRSTSQGGPGMNCLSWNMYWDFGSGQVGDMGSHTMDLAWNAIDAGLPTSAEGKGEPFNPEVTPVELHTTFEHPCQQLARRHPRPLVSGRCHAASSPRTTLI